MRLKVKLSITVCYPKHLNSVNSRTASVKDYKIQTCKFYLMLVFKVCDTKEDFLTVVESLHYRSKVLPCRVNSEPYLVI